MTPSISPRTSFYKVSSKAPQIKVKTSAQSISITIPEGIKLPVVATIEPAGTCHLQPQMFHFRAGRSGAQSTDTINEAEPQRSVTPGPIEDSDGHRKQDQGETAEVDLLLAAKSKKNRLNVSEASVPALTSSTVSAQGQIFVPDHEGLGESGLHGLHDHSEEKPEDVEETSDPPSGSTKGEQPIPPLTEISESAAIQATANDPTEEAPEPLGAPPNIARPPAHLFTLSESAVELLTGSSTKFGSPQPQSIPAIKIHKASVIAMPISIGTSAINNTNLPSTAIQAVVEQTTEPLRAGPTNLLTTAVGGLPCTDIPGEISTMTGSLSPASKLPKSGLPVVDKVGRRKRILLLARKILLKKHLLALMLGRELANLVHPQLHPVANVTGCEPLPVDGSSDMLTSYSRRMERRRDIQQKQLDQKIAATRIHAEAEEMCRCRICRGLTRTTYLKRYHRLQLKRDRPDMNMFDRRATAMGRVGAFKCKCRRRLLGVQNEVVGQDALPSQHLRAPAAIEPPLAGVDGAQQQ